MPEHPYNTAAYAACFSNLAEIYRAGEGGVYFFVRNIPGTSFRDLIILAPRLWLDSEEAAAAMVRDLKGSDFVSAVIVSDPLAGFQNFDGIFDIVRPFKTHYIVNCAQEVDLKGFHKSNLKVAQKKCRFERIHFADYIDVWMEQWNVLVEKHNIQGAARFSDDYFRKLADVPGLIAYGAFDRDGHLCSTNLWFEHGDYVVSHLNCSSESGYKAQANYGLYHFMMEDLKNKKFIDLGSNTGSADNPEDGLSKFKAGFSNTTRKSYICGVICDRERYEELAAPFPESSFFPRYRTVV